MRLVLHIAKHKSHISEGTILKHRDHVLDDGRFGHLHTDREDPDVIETELAVVTTKDV